MNENTNNITTEIVDGWVKTTVTNVTWVEQPDQITQLLQSRERLNNSLLIIQSQHDSISAEISDISNQLVNLSYKG